MEEENKTIEKPKRQVGKFWKIMSGVILVATIAILIAIKYYNPLFDIKWIVIISAVFFIVSVVTWFGFKIPEFLRKKNEEKEIQKFDGNLPAPISDEERDNIFVNVLASDKIMNMWDQIEDCGSEEHGEQVSQSIGFAYGSLCYGSNKIFLAINRHYPDRMRYKFNATQADMNSIKKKLAINPEKAPNKTIIRRSNKIAGIEEEEVKLEARKDENKEKQKQQEDLK